METDLSNIKLLWELVQYRGVTISVLFNDRDDQGDYFVPEIQTI